MKLVLAAIISIQGLCGSFDSQAADLCFPSATATAAKVLEDKGYHRTGSTTYEVVASSFGPNLQWKTVTAYRYENEGGQIAYATCDGTREYGFKPGTQQLSGGWFRWECPFAGCRAADRSHVLKSASSASVLVQDFTLGRRYGEDQLSIQVDLKAPPAYTDCTTRPGPSVVCTSHPEKKGTFVLTRQENIWSDSRADGLGGRIQEIQLQFNSTGDWIGASVLVPPFDFFKPVAVEPPSLGETLLIEDLPARSGIRTIPDRVRFSGGEARQLRIVNHSSFDVEVTGASVPRSVLLQDGTHGRTDEESVSVSAPSSLNLSPYPGSTLVVDLGLR